MSKEQDAFFRGVEKMKRDAQFKMSHDQAIQAYLAVVEKKRRESLMKAGEKDNYANTMKFKN